METNNNQTRRDIYNVIAVLKGSVEPGKLLHTSIIYLAYYSDRDVVQVRSSPPDQEVRLGRGTGDSKAQPCMCQILEECSYTSLIEMLVLCRHPPPPPPPPPPAFCTFSTTIRGIEWSHPI